MKTPSFIDKHPHKRKPKKEFEKENCEPLAEGQGTDVGGGAGVEAVGIPGNELTTWRSLEAQRFAQLLELGVKPKEAAKKAAGTTPQQIMTRPEVKEAVKKLVGAYTLPAEVRQAVWRAGVNKALVEEAGTKLGLEAARVAALDPEMGLQGGVPGVVINIGALEKVLEEAPPAEPVIDVEVVEEKGDE